MKRPFRAKIGLVYPKPTFAVSCEDKVGPANEFISNAPEGVTIVTARIPLEAITPDGLVKMGSYIEEASDHLSREKPDVIVFACTSGSFIKGIGYDREIIKRIEGLTGIPATTTTTAVIESLNSLKAKKIFLTTPYTDGVNQAEKRFMEASGFEITSVHGLGCENTFEIQKLCPEKICSFVKEKYSGDAEAIFISCTGLNIIDIIEHLETELGVPVITSNQATLWSSLRMLDITDDRNGLGRLFRPDSV